MLCKKQYTTVLSPLTPSFLSLSLSAYLLPNKMEFKILLQLTDSRCSPTPSSQLFHPLAHLHGATVADFVILPDSIAARRVAHSDLRLVAEAAVQAARAEASVEVRDTAATPLGGGRTSSRRGRHDTPPNWIRTGTPTYKKTPFCDHTHLQDNTFM